MTNEEQRPPAKIELGSYQYPRSLAVLAEAFLDVVQCKTCGAACGRGWACVRCGENRG